jgi:ParB family transcriptional regulator, chromosome partitioning protein
MQVRIDEIIIRDRIRKTVGEIAQLMESMKLHGQLSPILITPNKVLIAGNRRLEAARRLGWTSVEARITEDITELEKLEIEMDENVQRRNLTAEELADGYARIDRIRNPGLFRRIRQWIRNLIDAIVRLFSGTKR